MLKFPGKFLRELQKVPVPTLSVFDPAAPSPQVLLSYGRVRVQHVRLVTKEKSGEKGGYVVFLFSPAVILGIQGSSLEVERGRAQC